jgi:hypothetical protein
MGWGKLTSATQEHGGVACRGVGGAENDGVADEDEDWRDHGDEGTAAVAV